LASSRFVCWRTDLFACSAYKQGARGAADAVAERRVSSPSAPAVQAFLLNHRDELIARSRRAATNEQLANGTQLFLDRLTSPDLPST